MVILREFYFKETNLLGQKNQSIPHPLIALRQQTNMPIQNVVSNGSPGQTNQSLKIKGTKYFELNSDQKIPSHFSTNLNEKMEDASMNNVQKDILKKLLNRES